LTDSSGERSRVEPARRRGDCAGREFLFESVTTSGIQIGYENETGGLAGYDVSTAFLRSTIRECGMWAGRDEIFGSRPMPRRQRFLKKIVEPFLEQSVSSLRRGHANLLCIVPILTDVPKDTIWTWRRLFDVLSNCSQIYYGLDEILSRLPYLFHAAFLEQ